MRVARLVVALLIATATAAPADDRATLGQLERRSKTFYDLLARGSRTQARKTWTGLSRDLTEFTDRLQMRLDTMREAVMEADGDLEALYRSSRWREPELMSLVATYHLAWVRYHGARLTSDGPEKKRLLQRAVEGFSQFLLVNEVPEIYAECLYGRGLAFLELGDHPKAIQDLEAATAERPVAAKARTALAEARRRASGGRAPKPDGPETLLARMKTLLPKAARGDAAAEKSAMELARGLAARGGSWPSRVRAAVESKDSLRSSYGLFLAGQLAVDRKRCTDVASLAEAGASIEDTGRARHRPELLFLDAGCRLNAGEQTAAAEVFGVLLDEFPKSPRAGEAAYYRLRALDVAREQDPSLTSAYEEALVRFLEGFPGSKHVGEARFLLAELLRDRGECERATEEYARVEGGSFADRSRLGALECRVGALGRTTGAAERAGVRARLEAFAGETKDAALAAEAVLLAAAVAAGGPEPDHAAVVALLDDFEGRYPTAEDNHGRALGLRLLARVASGALDGTDGDLGRFLSADGAAEGRRAVLGRLSRDLGARAVRASGSEGEAALALARRVQAALVEITDDPSERVALADLELRAGEATHARILYEEALAADAGSAQALRGAARAAAAAGDLDAGLDYWRRVLESSPPGGTSWYEARLAQVTILRDGGRSDQACRVLRMSRSRPTNAGADQLAARLRGFEPEVCQ